MIKNPVNLLILQILIQTTTKHKLMTALASSVASLRCFRTAASENCPNQNSPDDKKSR
jgi:hypothetical protein